MSAKDMRIKLRWATWWQVAMLQTPTALWQFYKINRRYGNRRYAMRQAVQMTILTVKVAYLTRGSKPHV